MEGRQEGREGEVGGGGMPVEGLPKEEQQENRSSGEA